MAINAQYTKIPIDPEVIKLVSTQVTNLITRIQTDIENEKQISERTYKACNEILNTTNKEYIRIQIRFVEETRILIEKALCEPHVRFHTTWLHVFDIFASQCQQLTGPILQVLNSVAIESERLKHKYRKLVSGATASATVCTVLVGGLVMHFLPTSVCCFTLTTGGVVLAIVSTLLAAGLGIAFIIGAMDVAAIRAVYDKCRHELQTLLTKHMPCIFSEHKNVVTSQDLNQAIKDSLNTFKIKQDVWTNIDTLEMLKRSADCEIDALKQKQ